MALGADWFTEVYAPTGSAFSLKLAEKRLDQQSPFQHIEVYATEQFGNLMVIDGCVMLTERDNFLYHEMLAHPALYTHPHPERVLIIGGGDCGTLREVLKHPEIREVTQVDIDEAVTRAAERFFPTLCEANSDPRARLEFADGLAWVKQSLPASYDVIIVDSTDPVGPAEGLFTEPFFHDCYRVLTAEGVLVQQSESPLFHLETIIKPLHQALRRAGFADTHSLPFPQCVYPSGWWSMTLAVKAGKATQFRQQDAAAKSFPTEYYNVDVHQAALAMPEFMRRALHSYR